MTRSITLLGAFALLCAGSLSAQTLPGWNLIWADEFDQADGTAPNTAKWGYDLGGGGWGNNELQSYTDRRVNSRIESGQLVIEARKENFTGTDNIARNYTSARLLTKGKTAWTYGRIEARLKLPRGQGIWPAFWMLGSNIGSVGWPTCGEIDIMENIGREPNIVHGTVHGPGYSGGSGIGGAYTFPAAVAVADAFHDFAIEWETNRIRWFIDGTNFFTLTSSGIPAGKAWVFNAPQFVILNVAVGGNWPGVPNDSTVFPQQLRAEYVRVYARSNTTQTAEALVNPGFEQGGLSQWTKAGPNIYIESITQYPVMGGSNSVKMFGQFNGADNYSRLSQDVPTVPGKTYQAQTAAITIPADRLAGSNSAWLEVAFRGAAANVLSLYRSALLTSNSPAGVWHSLRATNQFNPANLSPMGSVTQLVAPASAASIRVHLVFRQPPGNASGSVFFDDVSLQWLKPPLQPVSLQAARAGENLALGFLTHEGFTYRVESKAPEQGAWETLTHVTGDGDIAWVSNSMSGAARFFRVATE